MGEAAWQLNLIEPPKPYEIAAPLIPPTPILRKTTREPNATGRIARERVRELAKSLKDDNDWPEVGWIRLAAREMGLKENTLSKILKGVYVGVSTETIDAIVKARGVERKYFFDPTL